MRSMLPSALLLLSFSALSHTRPLHPKSSPPTVKRASYSVVAVDGSSGSAATSSSGVSTGQSTIIRTQEKTTTTTASATTQTPTTKVVLSTIISHETEAPRTETKTIDVTEPAKTVDVTISIVNPAGPPTMSSALSSPTSTQSAAQDCTTTEPPPPPRSPSITKNLSSSIPTKSPTTDAIPTSEPSTLATASSDTPFTTPGQATATPPSPYNNGQLHTSYPILNMTSTAAPTGTATGTALRIS